MLQARPASGLEPLPESPASSQETYGCVVRADAGLARESLHACALDIDSLQGRRVLRLEGICEREDASASLRLSLWVRGQVVRGWLDACTQATCGIAAAMVVHESVLEHPEEPVHRGLSVEGPRGAFEASHEGGLQDVFGRSTVAEPPLEEGEEASMVVDQGLEDLGLRVWPRDVLQVPRGAFRRFAVMAHVSIPSVFRSSFEAESATVPAGWTYAPAMPCSSS